MSKEEALVELEAVRAGYEALYAAATEAADDCWWCCGGGDEWRAELDARKAAVLADHPELR